MLFSPELVTSRVRQSSAVGVPARVPGGVAGASVSAVFPVTWPVFPGHFPGTPVVPAYALLGLARAAAEVALGRPLEIERCERVKLTRPVRPGEEVRCDVVLEGGKARAQLSVGGLAAGSLVLGVSG